MTRNLLRRSWNFANACKLWLVPRPPHLASNDCRSSSIAKGLPISRRGNDPAHRRFLEAEDVVGMLMIADLCNAELPIFVAADLDREPGLYWSPGDVMSANVDKLTTAVTLLPVITKVFEMVLCLSLIRCSLDLSIL